MASYATNRFGPDAHIHVPDISPHRFLHAFDTMFWTIRSRKPAVGLVAPWSCVVWKLSPCWSSSWAIPRFTWQEPHAPGLCAHASAVTGNATRYMAASRWRCHREERGSGWFSGRGLFHLGWTIYTNLYCTLLLLYMLNNWYNWNLKQFWNLFYVWSLVISLIPWWKHIHDHGVKNHNSNTLGTIGYLQDWNHAQSHYPLRDLGATLGNYHTESISDMARR